MDNGQIFSVRSARVIAYGRALLTVSLYVSVLLGSLKTSSRPELVRDMLGAYLAYTAILAALSHSRVFAHRLIRGAVVLSAVDLLVFSTVIYLTSAADSPFFSPMSFLVLSATLQWGSRGAIVMGLVVFGLYIPAGLMTVAGADPDRGSAYVFINRASFVVVLTGLLIAFARHLERVVEELARLSDPLPEEDLDSAPPARACLTHAMRVFEAKRGLFVWVEGEEPYATLVERDGDDWRERRLPPGGDDWLIDPIVQDGVFLLDRRSGATLIRLGRRLATGPREPISAALIHGRTFDRILVIPAAADGLMGWALVLDPPEAANEDLAVGAMVSAQLSVALERWQSHRRRREAGAVEERLRLARDLHDGVLQLLAGAALQIDALLRGGGLSKAVATRLDSLRAGITDEQRELRGFIAAMRPARGDGTEAQRGLADELGPLAARLSRYWGVTVQAEVTPTGLLVGERMAYDLGRIVREAVANAVRHGAATRIDVQVGAASEGLCVGIVDNGRGFDFSGSLADEQLARAGAGPRSLHERVRALGGRLSLESSPTGARLDIEVPLGSEAA